MSAVGLKVEWRDGILILTLAHPPANELSPGLRAGLIEALATPDAKGVVIAAEGPNFSAQLPLDPDSGSPSLADLARAVADCPVPVVAVLQGLVTGPAAELVLAARARLAGPGLRIAFPEVTLGLCPAGGATQRLPRLVGAKEALRLLLGGKAIPAAEALALGLIDGITETAPVASAVRLAGALAVGDILRRAEPDPAAWTAAVAEARQGAQAQGLAGRRIVDCVEAALVLPSDSAQAFETVARADLQETAEALGLVAAARAERCALALPPVLARLQPLTVDRVGLVGTSPDLVRIAIAALSRGLSVAWAFPDSATQEAGVAAVEAGIGDGLRAGQLTPDRARRMTDRLAAVEGPFAPQSVPLLIGDPAAMGGEGWVDLPGAARLVLGGQAEEMGLALAPGGRVCEITLPADSLPLARATALAGLRRIGLAPVLVGHRPVLGARMADAGRTALAWMVSRGVPRRVISAALDDFGARAPDPVSIEVPTILRAMSAVEVLNRWLAALANEGARLLDEGIAKRPSDIDHIMVAGYQFPRRQGGPMHQAARRGLMVLRQDLRNWGAEASLWSPAPLIDRLIRDGQGLEALDR
ncbi:enoyl-CoA hydratase-related protein [Tabrizicola sp.]|uniref:enoyl-CoA hydratase-related protein n=1 Tax=Tabrizicola sp. TaxID=2005166 RepID=UPI002FDD755D